MTIGATFTSIQNGKTCVMLSQKQNARHYSSAVATSIKHLDFPKNTGGARRKSIMPANTSEPNTGSCMKRSIMATISTTNRLRNMKQR